MALSKFVVSMMIFMILSGSMNTLNDKFQNQQYVEEGGVTKYFYHPYMQTTVTYVAIALAFPIFFIRKKLRPEIFAERVELAKVEGKKTNFSPFLVLINAFSDIIATNLQGIALNFIPASAFQMMRGGTVASTFIFSIILLKMKPEKYQIIGVLLTIVGVLIVGTSSLISSSSSSTKNTDAGTEFMGYMFLIISLILNGFSFVYEQMLLNKYYVEPIELVGYQGIIGFIYNLIILVVVSFIPCSFGNDACVLTDDGSSYLERPEMYFRQLGDNKLLLTFCVLELFSILAFNLSSIHITKYINSLARSICDVTRTIFIWIVAIIITETLGKEKQNYRWEKMQAEIIILQLSGFVILLSGNLIYNQIIVWPCLKKVVESEREEGTLENTLFSNTESQ